jgi:glycine/serine hydroxymethyltransferase
MKEGDMEKVAEWMLQAINNRDKKDKLAKIRTEVVEYCLQFPLPSDEAS